MQTNSRPCTTCSVPSFVFRCHSHLITNTVALSVCRRAIMVDPVTIAPKPIGVIGAFVNAAAGSLLLPCEWSC